MYLSDASAKYPNTRYRIMPRGCVDGGIQPYGHPRCSRRMKEENAIVLIDMDLLAVMDEKIERKGCTHMLPMIVQQYSGYINFVHHQLFATITIRKTN